MGYIKKLKNNELVGGTDKTTIYPVTSTKAVFEEVSENNFQSQEYLNNNITGNRINKGTITDDNIAKGTITKGKLSSQVQTMLDEGQKKALTPKGNYNPEEVYEALDLVFDPATNSSYVSLVTPNTYPVDESAEGYEEGKWQKVMDGSYVNTAVAEIQTIIGEQLSQATAAVSDMKNDVDAAITQAQTDIQDLIEDSQQDLADATNNANGAAAQAMSVVANKVADAQIGYFECNTAANTSIKATTSDTIGTGTDASIFKVPATGASVKIKMKYANTVDTGVKLQFGSNTATQKDLLYNGEAISASNSWEEGEVISVYFDGTNYQASNAQGGGGKAEKIKYNNSQSGLSATDVQGALDETNDKITTRLLRVNFSVTVNVAVLKSGTYKTSKANGWCVTEPLTFSKGDVIILTATGAPTSALLSKVVVDKSTYIPILRFTQSDVEEVVKYVVEEDGQYAACAYRDHIKIEITQFGIDNAKGINYLNITSGLNATNVQDAIDETVAERLLPLEKIAENNEFITKITYDDLTTGRCSSSVNIIGRATTLSFLEKNNTYRQASYTQQVVKGQQFIVHNAYSYLPGHAYGYIIVNGGCLTEQFPQWQVVGVGGGEVNYDIIITCKTNGTIYINIAEGGYILKIDERIKIKDDSQYENVDCELCTHSITVSDDAYGVNFWTTGMIDDNGVMWLSYQCGAAQSGSSGEGNLGGMSHFPITKPWASESELTPHDTVVDDIAMNYPRGYIIKEITDDVIVRHWNNSIGEHGCICNWNKTQGTCIKNTITYDGNTVDYNLYNISQMLIDKGILEGSASGSTPWDFTRQVYANGYYWTMERSLQSNNICPVILKSLDCVNWEYVEAIPSITHQLSEGSIVVKDGIMYAVWRKDHNSDNNLTEYFIYDLNNNTLLLDETNLSGTINSRPSAFLYQENVYFVVNEISSIYNFSERRLQVAIYRVMPDYTLDRVYTLADANGINYHDVIVHGSYDSVYIRPSTYPHYATDQSVYMVYTSDRRHITQGGRKLSDIQLVNITPCLQPKYAGMQRYVNWNKANC